MVIEHAAQWFGEISMTVALPSAEAVLTEMVVMLDALQPRGLDRARSRVRDQGHGWTLEPAIEIHLAHRDDTSADVDVVVGGHEAIVSWLKAHEHVDEADGTADRPWTTAVVDAVAAVLRGSYVAAPLPRRSPGHDQADRRYGTGLGART